MSGRDSRGSAAWAIAPDVYALGPVGRTQTVVYFIRAGTAWAVVDTGWAADADRIRAAATELFRRLGPPVAILLTHHHPDHRGAAASLARGWGVAAHVHPAELAIAEGSFSAMRESAGPMDRAVVLPLLRAMGRRRREAAIARSSIRGEAAVLEPDGLVPGLPDWRWVHTPGHTPGHVSYVRPDDRVALTGDALVTLRVNAVRGMLFGAQGLSGPPWYTTWSRERAMASIRLLADLGPRVIGPGHGTPLTGPDTAEAVRAFADRIGASALAS
jgi:glyoxylase-like metal-dependent hydrolase (beta-lactamase superfamily II)